ncbi:MAG: 4Fe-4S binding protein [bacterium]|nr:4Fe-4S binding protein [bacterium]
MKIPISTKPNTTISNKTAGWSNFKPKFLHEKCTACGICPRVCPEGIIYQTAKTNSAGKKYFDYDSDYCKGCGLCAIECPFEAIKMEKEEK